MRVGKSIAKTIEEWEDGDTESAMLHACNSVDGTAKKVWPNLAVGPRFVRLLRTNITILGGMGAPGIDLNNTRFPLNFLRSSSPDGRPDIADLIYGVHRCCHGHGDELSQGFDLIPNAVGLAGGTEMRIEKGVVRLSDRILFAMIAIAVVVEVNADQSVPVGYHLTFDGQTFEINHWWGRRHEFTKIVDLSAKLLPSVILDFTDWMQ